MRTTSCSIQKFYMALALLWAFVWISEQTATFALYIINWLSFITPVERVYCAVRTDSLYKADYVSSFKVHNVRCKAQESMNSLLLDEQHNAVSLKVQPSHPKEKALPSIRHLYETVLWSAAQNLAFKRPHSKGEYQCFATQILYTCLVDKQAILIVMVLKARVTVFHTK